jgi:hypothetical protein
MYTVGAKAGFVEKKWAIISLHGMNNIKTLVRFFVATDYEVPHPRRRFMRRACRYNSTRHQTISALS